MSDSNFDASFGSAVNEFIMRNEFQGALGDQSVPVVLLANGVSVPSFDQSVGGSFLQFQAGFGYFEVSASWDGQFSALWNCKVDLVVPMFGRTTLLHRPRITFQGGKSQSFPITHLEDAGISGDIVFAIQRPDVPYGGLNIPSEVLMQYMVATPFTGQMEQRKGVSLFPIVALPLINWILQAFTAFRARLHLVSAAESGVSSGWRGTSPPECPLPLALRFRSRLVLNTSSTRLSSFFRTPSHRPWCPRLGFFGSSSFEARFPTAYWSCWRASRPIRKARRNACLSLANRPRSGPAPSANTHTFLLLIFSSPLLLSSPHTTGRRPCSRLHWARNQPDSAALTKCNRARNAVFGAGGGRFSSERLEGVPRLEATQIQQIREAPFPAEDIKNEMEAMGRLLSNFFTDYAEADLHGIRIVTYYPNGPFAEDEWSALPGLKRGSKAFSLNQSFLGIFEVSHLRLVLPFTITRSWGSDISRALMRGKGTPVQVGWFPALPAHSDHGRVGVVDHECSKQSNKMWEAYLEVQARSHARNGAFVFSVPAYLPAAAERDATGGGLVLALFDARSAIAG
ncbi:hypothetical protein C8F04DRAFT_1195305 [Mycena alexandri]|uniref:Uncharacterized protein n=1 Tax=Mycena alexandri TaxID=1745969 RepID=A0AAD6S6K4_9AGAR|nr:hypothetical protein C8F04DRAFT_1195305 [Mycena alexandri]